MTVQSKLYNGIIYILFKIVPRGYLRIQKEKKDKINLILLNSLLPL